MKNLVRDALDRRGMTPLEAHHRGMPYQSVYRQYRGDRNPSAEYALLYERILGIPRSELRPDLWPPEGASSPADARESEPGGIDGATPLRREREAEE